MGTGKFFFLSMHIYLENMYMLYVYVATIEDNQPIPSNQ